MGSDFQDGSSENYGWGDQISGVGVGQGVEVRVLWGYRWWGESEVWAISRWGGVSRTGGTIRRKCGWVPCWEGDGVRGWGATGDGGIEEHGGQASREDGAMEM
eukprot:766073-Hanusia_phi.AAC.6